MNHCTEDFLKAFEREIVALWEAGELPYLIHLCGGNEAPLIEIFKEIHAGDWVFSSHRNHYHYLLSGGSPSVLQEKIKRGDSMFVFGRVGTVRCAVRDESSLVAAQSPEPARNDAPGSSQRNDPTLPEVNFISSSILAGTCAMAAGVAWDLKQSGTRNWVWCFLGDGAEDEGHFHEAVRFVEGWDLPCTFVIEDNNRQVETSRSGRHGPRYMDTRLADAAKCVRRYHYTPTYPHAGSGCEKRFEFKPGPVQAFAQAEHARRGLYLPSFCPGARTY